MLHTGAIKFRGHTLIWKTWAPLIRIKIYSYGWCSNTDTGPMTGEHAMAWRRERTAICVIKLRKPWIILSHPALTPGRSGSISAKRSDSNLFHNLHQSFVLMSGYHNSGSGRPYLR